MSISVYPVTGDITAAGFAAALDKLFGEVDHASDDLAFALRLQSQSGGYNTWVLTAGSYIFDGYIFTSDGADTQLIAEGAETSIYLYYTLSGGYVTAKGISTSSSAGTNRIKLWKVKGPTAGSTAPGTITDYRRINTWGRTAVASTAVDAITLSAARECKTSFLTSLKSFRVAYPGSYQLDFEYIVQMGQTLKVQRTRGGIITSLSTPTNSEVYKAYSYAVNDCMPGDTIDIVGSDSYVRNVYLRYKLTDASAPAVLVD